nr:hypothetical protein [Tanacetum cinerariifolium]
NPRNRQIAQLGMNMGQDRQIQMVGGNGENQFRQYDGQNVGNLNGYNAVQNVKNQKEEVGIQLQAEEFDLMAVAADLDEIKGVNANCILMANLQQASTSGTQIDKAPVYDGSAEVHDYENCDDNEIFNMSTQEEEYTELLEPISEPHQVSVQKDITRGTSKNTKFAKQSILRKPPMLGKTHALSKPVTSNSVPTAQESKVVKNDKVIAPGVFRINPFKTSREEKHVPNTVRASARIKPITASQPPVITKKDVNSDSNGLSST